MTRIFCDAASKVEDGGAGEELETVFWILTDMSTATASTGVGRRLCQISLNSALRRPNGQEP